MDYIIKLENFEGPFDLLLELIKKREMNIFDLQISQITTDYLHTLEQMKEKNIDITSDFMEVASILLNIKSKMMLPVEMEKEDPRDELVQQLLDYKEYKEAVEKMKQLKEMEQKFYKTQKTIRVKKKKNGTLQDILRTYYDIFSRTDDKKEDNASPFSKLAEQLSKSRFTMEDRMDHLKQVLDVDSINVKNYFEQVSDREELIVTFSAILELVKVQFIKISLREDQVFIEKRGEEHGEKTSD